MECCGVEQSDGCGVEQSEVECWEWSSLNSEVECCGVEQSEVECWGVNNLKWNVLE